MTLRLSKNQVNRITYDEEEYKKIPLNKENTIKLLKAATKKATKSFFIGISLVTVGGLLTDKNFNIKKVLKKPSLLLDLIYSLRFTPMFAFSHSFLYTIISETLPIITKWSFLTSDIIAGLISGFSCMMDTQKQQSFVSLWSLSNFVQAGCLYLDKENILRIPHGAKLIFSSFVSQLFYSLLYHPLSLPAPDLRNLKSLIPLGSVKNLLIRNENEGYDPTLFEIVAGNRYGATYGTLCSHSHSQNITCEGNSVLTGIHFARENFNYFFAISIIPTLILNSKSLRKRPFSILGSKLMNLGQTLSTISLTSALLNYIACKSSWSISTRNYLNPLRHLSAIQAFLAGLLGSCIPNNKRLIYFNSIMGMSAVTSLFNILRKKNLIFKMPLFHPICYSVCYTILLALMRRYPSVLSPTMLVGLKSFFIQGRILKPVEDEIDDDQTERYNDDQIERYHEDLAERYHEDLVERYDDYQAEDYDDQTNQYDAEYSKID